MDFPSLQGQPHIPRRCYTTHFFSHTNLARDLVTQLLKVDPEERLTAELALGHNWFQVVFPYKKFTVKGKPTGQGGGEGERIAGKIRMR
jgi:hypothetical protein